MWTANANPSGVKSITPGRPFIVLGKGREARWTMAHFFLREDPQPPLLDAVLEGHFEIVVGIGMPDVAELLQGPTSYLMHLHRSRVADDPRTIISGSETPHSRARSTNSLQGMA
jgi:hypothetical protein